MRRRIRGFLATIIAIIALTFGAPAAATTREAGQAIERVAPAEAADDSRDQIEEELVTWQPVDIDPSVRAPAFQEYGTDALVGCASGSFQEWTYESGVTVRLFWMECGSPRAAVDRARAEWSDYSYLLPAPGVAPALGADLEITARFTADSGDPMILRMWAQGAYFIGVQRTCQHNDVSCEDANARDAQSVAALSSVEAGRLSREELGEDDALHDFTPADADGPWVLRYSRPADTTVAGEDARCGDGMGMEYVNPIGEAVKLFWVDCPTVARAQELSTDYWSTTDSAGLARVHVSGDDGVTRLPEANGSRILRWWIQGQRYIQIEQSCADGDEVRCADRTAAYLQAITTSTEGSVQPLTDWSKAFWALAILFVVPIATYLVIHIPRRLVARRRQREIDPTSEADATVTFVSVDRLAQRTRAGRIVRRVIIVVLGTIASVVLALQGLYTQQLAVQTFSVFVAPFLVFFMVGGILDLIWRPNRLVRPPRRRSRPSLRGLAGMLLRGAALLLAMSTLVLYLFVVMFMWFSSQQSEAAFRASIDQVLGQTEGLATLLAYALLGLYDLQHSGWIVVLFFAMVAIPIFLAYLVDRLGRRLARRSLLETLAHDDRAHFLYLRGFDEDRLRIDESLGRRGFLEVFSPFGRPRFEEVLAEQLSAWGPVIAISGTRQRLQDLGAAKISFEGEEWRDQVETWIGGARAVVISATPSQVREGLEWEIAHLATREDAPPMILVISPWPRAERQRRWSGFLARAGQWEMFRPLIERQAPSATHILTYSGSRGWTAYGATRRWDWSYAASLLTAIENGDLERSSRAFAAPESMPPPPNQWEPEHA